jgi:hypothetical protein
MTHQELYVGALLDQSLHDLQQGANSDMGQKVNTTGLLKPDTPFGPIILGERLFDPPETIVKQTLACNLLHL